MLQYVMKRDVCISTIQIWLIGSRGCKMSMLKPEILDLFDELSPEAQERIIYAAAASIREQLNSQSPCDDHPIVDRAFA